MAEKRDQAGDKDHIEALEPFGTRATYIDSRHPGLSPEHREYLLRRHGSLDLDPLPGYGDADPYNWSRWKVCNPQYSIRGKGTARLTYGRPT
jgi:hypothetical protein